jgi:predicted anti-sigma-YlaC factor YlaD
MLCWFFRFMISHTVDKDSRPSGITEKHIRHCADCRQFYKSCQSLGERLTLEAAASNDGISSRLSEHILMAIPGRRTEVKNAITKIWIPAAAACVALVVLIGAFLLVGQRNGRDNVQPDRTQMAVAIHELRSVYRQLGQELTITWPLAIEKPLASEFKSLTNDTQSAVRFLVACVNVDIADAEGGVLN